MNNENREVLLKVDHLEQFFKLGKRTLKAVNDVNFEIYKGEVFGLVGESGCGKTTTGRSIIKLYDITGGSVYFGGTRIAAGVRRYKDAIKQAKATHVQNVKSYKAEMSKQIAEGMDKVAAQAEYNEKVAASSAELLKVVEFNTAEIKSARDDHRYCNKRFAEAEVAKVQQHYAPLLEAATSEEEKEALTKEMNEQIRVAKKDRIMNKIQMIFQDPIASLDPRMTVHDIIAEGLIIRGIKDKKVIQESVYKVLEMVGLVPEHATRYPHEFSGGQRQRIGIARAIILNPDLIIADEPISALDVSIQAQVINLLNELREQMGLTILFIAHDISVVKYFSDRIAVMYFGKIVELATSDELFKNPLHPYTKSLLSAIPLPDPNYEKQRQRITYNPLADHDYSVEGPTMREITPGHFIYCNSVEFEKYQKELK